MAYILRSFQFVVIAVIFQTEVFCDVKWSLETWCLPQEYNQKLKSIPSRWYKVCLFILMKTCGLIKKYTFRRKVIRIATKLYHYMMRTAKQLSIHPALWQVNLWLGTYEDAHGIAKCLWILRNKPMGGSYHMVLSSCMFYLLVPENS